MNFFTRLMDDSIYQAEVVLLDQDEAEHKNIKKFLPSARILLCQFHVLKAVSRYINSEESRLQQAGGGRKTWHVHVER